MTRKQKILRFSLALAVAFFFSLPASFSVAQETALESSSEPQFALLPRIYASDINANVNENNFITGSFIIRNSETAVIGNIQYEVQLLDSLEKASDNQIITDNPRVYFRQRSKEQVTLAPGEIRTIPFDCQMSNGIKGNYRLRIQLTTSNDRELGWGDKELKFNGTGNFIAFETKNVNVDSVEPLTKEHKNSWAPLEGINVNPVSPLTLSAKITNLSNKQLSGVLDIRVKRFLYKDAEIFQTRGEKIILAGQATKNISIPLVTKNTPGAYIVLVKLINDKNEQISGIGEYRYVVRGQSASVASVQLKGFPNYKNGLAEISFVVAGSADRVTPVNGLLKFILKDDKGTLGEGEKEFKISNVVPALGTAKISLTRPLCGVPAVSINITSDEGKILDSYEMTAANFASKSCGNSFYATNINGVVIFLVAIIGILLYKFKTGRKFTKRS